ncbi:MAG TPA: DUF6268 family outer membrane beta-barrel protein [Bacteroidia bacterium]|nr:DUF6268 family outer membrane beta-barrel protein [Bacteroidia bacterium]
MQRAKLFPLLFCWLIFFMPVSLLHAGTGDTLLVRKSDPDSYREGVRSDTSCSQLRTPDSRLFHAAKQHEVRNYIRPCLYTNFYATGSRPIESSNSIPNQALTARLGNYKFVTSNIGFYCPLYTHTSFSGSDSSDVNTFHLLMTMNALSDQPQFFGLDKQHKIYKVGVGVRMIYGFGSKFILFADASPYVVGDKYDKQTTQQVRLASSLVFNCMINPRFSVRVGVTKTFLFGNRFYLPMFGLRLGKLDSKFYFSFQFPRLISFNFQPTPKFSFSLYSKKYGGLYSISNGDSLYPFGDKIIHLGQTGISTGIRFDFRPGPNFSFFLSTGFDSRNHIALFSQSYNAMNHLKPFAHFYDGRPDPTLFLNFGITWRFGKAKKSAGNYLMYDIMDLNNTMDPGDNNAGPGNGDIRNGTEKDEMKKVQYKDVSDLIDDTDLY